MGGAVNVRMSVNEHMRLKGGNLVKLALTPLGLNGNRATRAYSSTARSPLLEPAPSRADPNTVAAVRGNTHRDRRPAGPQLTEKTFSGGEQKDQISTVLIPGIARGKA